MGLSEFLNQPAIVVLFYSIVILLVIINRRRFEIQSKIVALYKTQLGLKLMDYLAGRYREQLKIIGYAAMGLALILMFVISFLIIFSTFNVIIHPKAGAGLVPVLPGVRVPGVPKELHLPLLEGIISIFLVAVIHEFSHGVLARCYNIKVRSSGIFFMGPILGAFVEPDEKTLNKSEDIVQYSILSAGPIVNLTAGLIILLTVSFIMGHAPDTFTVSRGLEIVEINESYPIAGSGLEKGMLVTEVNGISTLSPAFHNLSLCMRPDDMVIITADKGTFYVIAGRDPDNPKRGRIGVTWMLKREPKNPLYGSIYSSINWFLVSFSELLKWLVILNLGIGGFNLLPIGPTDGGRILRVMLHRIKGEKEGDRMWKSVGLFFIVLLLLNLLLPMMRAIVPVLAGIFGAII